ncbi:MAG: hypothetical protein CVV64_13675 [Candidatus Wallbacteria bacterium HGW-Wallbacteria-1]|jgi:hypothetical protein|uniref:Uncharacterized protein n=1 Tax=Candidatus Wallbacteria bacterium HGW-Wallbacteria-1 TaxID=2013854 RepID=A0A2N1PMR2_9BACT|nr:MAG: hypothetical protein CVV64_13675 [Candidatus Wallbacteria bacterium HGW-Wallbacteria-1]
MQGSRSNDNSTADDIRDRLNSQGPWGPLGTAIFLTLITGSGWALYLLRNLVFVPFDLLQAVFILGVVLLVTIPGTWAIKGICESSRLNGLTVIAVAVTIPVLLSFIIRDTFAYRLQLLHLSVVSLKDGSPMFAGREDRLVDTARSGSPDRVPMIASILVHLGKLEDARSLLLRVIGLTYNNYLSGEERVLAVPVLLSMPGRGSLRELRRIYDISTVKSRRTILEGMSIFAGTAAALGGTAGTADSSETAVMDESKGELSNIENWSARLDIDSARIMERVQEVSEWLAEEARKSPVPLMREIIQTAMILPRPMNFETVAYILENIAPSGLNGGLARELEPERAVAVMAAIPPSFFHESSERGKMEQVIDRFLSSRTAAGVQALDMIRDNDLRQMLAPVTRNMAMAAINWFVNRDFCLAAMDTIESLWQNRRGKELADDEKVVWGTLEAMLSHGDGNFSGRAAVVLATRDPARAAGILEEKINMVEMERGGRPGFYSNVMKSLAKTRRQTAVTLACGAIRASGTPQSLKRKSAEILMNIQAFECAALLGEYSRDESIEADPQTRAILADASTRLNTGHRGPL